LASLQALRFTYLLTYSLCGSVRVQDRFSDSYRSISHLNAHPESLGPTLKLFFKFTSYFGCFLMCILYRPSGGCYFIETCVGTVLPVLIRQHILSTGACTILYSTGIDLCNILVLLSCIYVAHTGWSADSHYRCPYCRHSLIETVRGTCIQWGLYHSGHKPYQPQPRRPHEKTISATMNNHISRTKNILQFSINIQKLSI